MPTEARPPLLAVLIDAENASAKIADALFKEIAAIGEAAARRIYGDFTSPQMRSWTEVLARHAIQPQLHLANTTGKNASDIALVIDAMDLLHSDRFDGFCLVSSDSDFTRLASRIREEGKGVFGFGERKTPESFTQACTRFIYTENLTSALGARPTPPAVQGQAKRTPAPAAPLIEQAIASLDDEDGWVTLGAIGTHLRNAYPDFDQRTYGYAKLSDLIRNLGQFEVERSEPGGAMRIRRKES
jgi:uncharacterized LabA/DUF88 family protein